MEMNGPVGIDRPWTRIDIRNNDRVLLRSVVIDAGYPGGMVVPEKNQRTDPDSIDITRGERIHTYSVSRARSRNAVHDARLACAQTFVA